MKTPDSPPDRRWAELIRQARTDAPPPVDTAALLRAVRGAAPEPAAGWFAEFAALFALRRALPVCLAATALMMALTTWQAVEVAHALPWAQLVMSSEGGEP